MKLVPEVRSEFYAEAARSPETAEQFEAQKTLFPAWRGDVRFQSYWSVLDALLSQTFDQVCKWAAIQAELPLQDYDHDAVRA